MKAIFTLTLCAMLSLSVLAQPDSLRNATDGHKAKAIAARMTEDLQLTPTQTNAVEKLALERFQNLKLENQEDHARFERVNQKAAPKLKAILTKAQLEKYQALRADAKKQKDEFLQKNPNHRFIDADTELDF